jgi:flagella basal body P-ring formation protein FlgA
MKTNPTIKIFTLVAALLLCTAAWAGTDQLFDKVQKAVKENLSGTVSEKVEVEELRIIKGAEYFAGGHNDMTIQNMYMDGYSGRNKVIYAVYLKDKTSKTANVVVEAAYDVFEDVFVTARALPKGEVLTSDDYYSVRQKRSKLPVGAITDRSDIEGKILKSSVTDGVIIRSNYLLSSATVKRGQKVSVIVEGENVTISAKGSLRRDTAIGQSATVLCDLTKKEVSGILVSPTLVKVKI